MKPEFKHHQFESGLTVIAECSDDSHTAAVGFFVRTGARDEDSEVMGVSHYLEHMVFKGTSRRFAEDVNRRFDELGANYNAFTGHEQTVFFAQVLPENLTSAVELLGDILRPSLRESDFEMEKNVILEEISMYEDRPEWRLQDTLLEAYFGSHPLSFRVLGTRETVTSLTADQMRCYFESRYSADNIVVAAAGRIDFTELLESVERITSTWRATGVVREYPSCGAGEVEKTITDGRLSRHYLGVMCAAPGAQDDRRYAAKVLADVLGDNEGSRLYWALVDPGFAEEADFSFFPQDRIGCFLGFSSCSPHRSREVEEKLLEILDHAVRQADFQSDEIERAKNKVATQVTVQGELPLGRMKGIGLQWCYLDRYMPLDEELSHLMEVTTEQIRDMLSEMPLYPRSLVRLGPPAV